jgi:hypothetical protein
MTTREITPEDVITSEKIKYKAKVFSVDYRNNFKTLAVSAGYILVGAVLIFLGLTNTGSFYTSAGKFGGFLATLFYEWQFGTFMTVIGAILIYDAIKSFK